ncbi:Peptide transporter PTR2 [Platanthera zijinensis]|uniref:Peptide transporter PTR2 n=1 Tax=Platanthera zijinensis TaxID=2320716 RepID=A0AAP0BYL3_9ASPA
MVYDTIQYFVHDYDDFFEQGMSTLTLSASVPQLKPPVCVASVCPEATAAQYTVFFLGVYLIALGTGGIKPCVSSLGADQFDDTDAWERAATVSDVDTKAGRFSDP